MNLKSYLDTLPRSVRAELAVRCGTSAGHLKNIAYGYKPCAEILAVNLERETAGRVSRRELRPTDWWLIWPELAVPPQLSTHIA